MEDLSGKQFGQYQIVAEIGEGGMAAVYKAYQPSVERFAAIKVLPKQLARDPQFIKRFRQEALVLARLQHPHILPVFDYGEAEGYTYLVMPYIDSGTLKDILRGKPLPLKQIRSIISQVGDALDYAHTHGLVHRDVKPSNVLVDERGNCLLTDFGIAKMVEGTSKLTGSGGVIGTPAYMAPEQGRGDPVDARSDIYALGIMLFEMTTGRVPFEAETPVAVIFKHIQDDLPAPRALNPDLPEAVECVIQQALAKNPAERFTTAREMVDALLAALPSEVDSASIPAATRRPSTDRRPAPQPGRRSAACLWLGAGAAVVSVLAILAGALYLANYFRSMGAHFAATQTAIAHASQPTKTLHPSRTPSPTEIVWVVTATALVEDIPPAETAHPTDTTTPQFLQPPIPTLAASGTPLPTAELSPTQAPLSTAPSVVGNWLPLLDLPRNINALVVDPNDPQIIYAGAGSQSSGSGVYKSTDGGMTWQSASQGLPYDDVRGLTISQGVAPILYAIVASGDVYTSPDGALSWNQCANPGLYGGFEARLSTDPSGDILFAIVVPGGLARSADGGQSWQKMGQGLPTDEQGNAYVRSVVFGSTPGVIYAGTGGFVGQGHGVYQSTDWGENWTAVNRGMVDYVITALAVSGANSPHDAQTVYAASETGELFVSADGAQSWEDLSAGLAEVMTYNAQILDIFIDPATPGSMALSSESDGILFSSDGGRSWQPPLRPGGDTYTNLTAARVIFQPSQTIFVGQRDLGGFRYAPGQPVVQFTPTPQIFPIEVTEAPLPAGVWQALVDLPRQINAFAINPADSQTVFAGTGENGSGSGVYKSIDRGLTWILTANGLPSQDVLAVAIAGADSGAGLASPDNPLTIYAGLSGSSDFYISSNGAQSWAFLGSSGTYGSFGKEIIISPLDSQLLFTLSSPDEMARSTNGGVTWQLADGGLPADEYRVYVLSLACDPADPQIVYAGTGGFGNSHGYGVYKSTDRGQTWNVANTGMLDRVVTALAVSPADPQTVFAGTSQGELFISKDGAQSWINISDRLPWSQYNYAAIHTLIIDPTRPGFIYLLADNYGIMVSSSGGAGWQELGLPPGQSGVYANMAILFGDPSVFLLSMDGEGGWRYAP